MKSTSY